MFQRLRSVLNFHTIVFMLCIGGCLGSTVINSYTARLNQVTVSKTFGSLTAQAVQANQITIAQDYAMTVSTLAEYEAGRAHELEQILTKVSKEYVKLNNYSQQLQYMNQMNVASLKEQRDYIYKLLKFIQANNLSPPTPKIDRTKQFLKEPSCPTKDKKTNDNNRTT